MSAINQCTFDLTGAVKVLQYYRTCRTCSMATGELVEVCLNCASICHESHILGPTCRSNFTCVCFDTTHLCRATKMAEERASFSKKRSHSTSLGYPPTIAAAEGIVPATTTTTTVTAVNADGGMDTTIINDPSPDNKIIVWSRVDNKARSILGIYNEIQQANLQVKETFLHENPWQLPVTNENQLKGHPGVNHFSTQCDTAGLAHYVIILSHTITAIAMSAGPTGPNTAKKWQVNADYLENFMAAYDVDILCHSQTSANEQHLQQMIATASTMAMSTSGAGSSSSKRAYTNNNNSSKMISPARKKMKYGERKMLLPTPDDSEEEEEDGEGDDGNGDGDEDDEGEEESSLFPIAEAKKKSKKATTSAAAAPVADFSTTSTKKKGKKTAAVATDTSSTATPAPGPAAPAITTGGKQKRAPRPPDAPKGPSASYMIYSNSVRDTIRAENPTMKMVEISKFTSMKWRAMKAEEKVPYEEAARKDRERYEAEMEEYRIRKLKEEGIVIKESKSAKKKKNELKQQEEQQGQQEKGQQTKTKEDGDDEMEDEAEVDEEERNQDHHNVSTAGQQQVKGGGNNNNNNNSVKKDVAAVAEANKGVQDDDQDDDSDDHTQDSSDGSDDDDNNDDTQKSYHQYHHHHHHHRQPSKETPLMRLVRSAARPSASHDSSNKHHHSDHKRKAEEEEEEEEEREEEDKYIVVHSYHPIHTRPDFAVQGYYRSFPAAIQQADKILRYNDYGLNISPSLKEVKIMSHHGGGEEGEDDKEGEGEELERSYTILDSNKKMIYLVKIQEVADFFRTDDDEDEEDEKQGEYHDGNYKADKKKTQQHKKKEEDRMRMHAKGADKDDKGDEMEEDDDIYKVSTTAVE